LAVTVLKMGLGDRASQQMLKPVVASDRLVEVGRVVANGGGGSGGGGAVLLLTNWRMRPTVGLTLTIDNSSGWMPAFETARLGSTNAEVKIKAVDNMLVSAPFDVKDADALVFTSWR
jgi:hypothetical protein